MINGLNDDGPPVKLEGDGCWMGNDPVPRPKGLKKEGAATGTGGVAIDGINAEEEVAIGCGEGKNDD